MRELLAELLRGLERDRPLVYCSVVETRGSTPQKAGALMLVYEDGLQAGTLGGGCVEAEVKRRALAVLGSGQAEVAKFQLDSDYGWDDGLICGGRMQVLIEPLTNATSRAYFEQLPRHAVTGLTEAIVYDRETSGLDAPASFLFAADGKLITALHGSSASGAPDLVREHLQP